MKQPTHQILKNIKIKNKTTFILGDSIVKDLDGYLLTGSLQKKFIVKVRSFSSATTECMWDYCKPTLRKDDLVV